jgi:undecaprenyl-diphosphatase
VAASAAPLLISLPPQSNQLLDQKNLFLFLPAGNDTAVDPHWTEDTSLPTHGPMRATSILLVILLTFSLVHGQPTPSSASTEAKKPETTTVVPKISTRDAIILGIVEGLTEFLPVSSTGHLIVATTFLGLKDDRQLVDAKGELRWITPPSAKHPEGRPLSAKAAADAFNVIVQVGAIIAVVFLYWGRLWTLVQGMCGQSRSGLLLLRNIILAVIPAAVLGLALDDMIEEKLFCIEAVVGAAAVGAVLMIVVDIWMRRRRSTMPEINPADLSPAQSLMVGFMQCLAMWPGTSRSMMTIVGGYCVGLRPAQAAEFSFLVGLPTLAGAALLKGYKTGPAMIELFGWSPILIGLVVAFVVAALSIKFLIATLTRVGLTPFAIYRILLAITLPFLVKF